MGCSIQIRISKEVKERLNEFKDYPRETYNDVIIKLINNNGDEDGRRE